MKKLITTICVLLISSIYTFSQLNQQGFTIGGQLSKSYVKPAYGSTYKDNFNYINLDIRYYGVSENFAGMVDATGAADLAIMLGMVLAGKKDFELTGKMNKIQDYAGANAKAWGADWSYFQANMAWGAEGIYVGGDFDMGSIGVTKMQNTSDFSASPNGDGYIAVGGVVYIINEMMRSSLRIDRTWLGRQMNQKGMALVLESDVALGKFFYAGVYYKFKRFKDGGEGLPKFAVNTFGVRTGIWIGWD